MAEHRLEHDKAYQYEDEAEHIRRSDRSTVRTVWRSLNSPATPNQVIAALAVTLLVGAGIVFRALAGPDHLQDGVQDTVVTVGGGAHGWPEAELPPADSGVTEAGADLVTNVSALSMSTAALEHRMVRLGAATNRHTVKAIVFYGRRGTVQMLNCYLERNLRRNGGLISEVLMMVKTESEADLAFLDKLIERNPEYTKRDLSTEAKEKWGWLACWQDAVTEPDTFYVKIDDDIVFIEDNAIQSLLEAKLAGGYSYLAANVVNHPSTSWIHAQIGALRGWRRESNASRTWVPLAGHKGLEGSDAENISLVDYKPCAWRNPICAAQSHYSFFEHYKSGSLEAFYFPMWDLNGNWDGETLYGRWSVNLFLFKGSEMGNVTEHDDEAQISQEFCRDQPQHCGVVGRGAVAAHYSYYTQRSGLGTQTDVLKQYRDIALSVCGELVRYNGDTDENAAMVATTKSKTKPRWADATSQKEKPKWKPKWKPKGATKAAAAKA